MDPDRFDSLTRGLNSRRAAITGLFGGIAGLTGWVDPGSADAHKRRKKKRKQKQRKKQEKNSRPDVPPPPTCNDGVKNGNETGVDCGGSCVRCVNGNTCASRDDCLSGLCLDSNCEACGTTAQCNGGADGPCACEGTAEGTVVCNSSSVVVDDLTSCGQCPPGTNCFAGFGGFKCMLPCGAE